MRVRFWGVRGAFAATEGTAQAVGGNTPCVEVRGADGALIILDAGIGLYWLGRSLLTGPHGRGEGEATILLSHTHWDHIQGFPFFVPGFIPGNQVAVWGGGVAHLESILEGQMNPTYSPIVSLANMGATIQIGDLATRESLEVGGIRITHATFRNGPHDIVGYRLEESGRSLCYIAEVDHPDPELDPEVVRLAQGVDVLIHESYYTNEELKRGGRSLAGGSGPLSAGHSSFGQATDVALAANAKRLHYFYFNPDHDDASIESALEAERRRVAGLGRELSLSPAREGYEFEV